MALQHTEPCVHMQLAGPLLCMALVQSVNFFPTIHLPMFTLCPNEATACTIFLRGWCAPFGA